MLKRITVTLAVVFLASLGSLAIFGDNLRRLFGKSADALAGSANLAHDLGHVGAGLERKAMKSFGSNSLGAPAEAALPQGALAQGNTHAQVAPNLAVDTQADALSTFAIDVDTASYTIGRSTLAAGQLPVPSGVRVEEWVNAFRYQLPAPKDAPFAVSVEGAPSPFVPGRTLLKVALQGRQVANADRAPANLVFLVDTSCSMSGPDRLGLAQESLRILTRNLNARDTVSVVTYASGVRDVLGPTPASQQRVILDAIDGLSTAGGTAMGSGLELAYRHALRGAREGALARVIVLTDGDANIGDQSADSMLAAVRGYVKEGVTLTAVGFGMGNYRDALMERLADSGNGQSVYLDSRAEALKVFEQNVAGTLEVIARDVKVQVAFDPRVVTRYRLLGYENRAVADADFRNDAVDGGEIGAGHSVTALYELELAAGATAGNLGSVAVRGQRVGGVGPRAFETEAAITRALLATTLPEASSELRFAAAVAGAADVLRGNGAASSFSLEAAISLARGATRGLPEREEFVRSIEAAQQLQRPQRL